MANLSKIKRDKMLAFLSELKKQHTDDESIRAFNEIENHLVDKKYGLVWEKHSEEVDEKLKEYIPVLCSDPERRLCKDPSLPWNFIIEGDNLQALYLLEKTHRGKVDCIYIDPPYNTGARDWKYNNDYVDSNDLYRHSKWLSMMETRLRIAKRLLNPSDSVLICTIDEKEYLHLGCLLEELFPEARIQMVSTCINPGGVSRGAFRRVDEYIFFVMIGDSLPSALNLGPEWFGGELSKHVKELNWRSFSRAGSNSNRSDRPNLFYPIFVKDDLSGIQAIGETFYGSDRNTVEAYPNTIVVWPLHQDGSEAYWMYTQEGAKELIKKGFFRIGNRTKKGVALYYLNKGEQQKIEKGVFRIIGRNQKDGSIITETTSDSQNAIAPSQWRIPSHNARTGGTEILKRMIGPRFSFPKSVYAVHDTIRFFVSHKPNSIILDFFAGSGTTMHAVNLLNTTDEGHRRCIIVTNNELSEKEEIELASQGFVAGDETWESYGIARYVTWPRTVCSIEGRDINGNPLKGKYLGSNLPMDDGFNANVKYFKCDWTPRHPEEYLLSHALCLHIKEMIELQNAIEVDGKKNVLILNKGDLKRFVGSKTDYDSAERIWVNQTILMNSDELKMLEKKGFSYIPEEFFGQELKEAAE